MSSSPPPLATGTAGPWMLAGLEGTGAVASVYRCHHPDDPDTVRVCKRLHDPTDAEAVALLAKEAQVLARVRHPHIVGLVDVGPGWIVLEHVPGGPLRAAGSPGAMRTQLALRRMLQLTDALTCLHGHGIAHRDLSAENIRVRPDGWLVVLDFGRSGGPTDPLPGGSAGTPAYRPPEGCSGDPFAADLYAVGVLFFELLEGRSAFEGMAPADLVATKRAGPLRCAQGGPGPRALVAALTHPDPGQRPGPGAVHRQVEALLRQAGDTAAGTGTLAPDSAGGPDGRAGSRSIERYELVGELGRGGMGVVYEAWDPALQRAVALKTAPLSPGGQERFRREARAVGRLRHPHIVQVLDFGQTDQTLFYTMELVSGPSLRTTLHDRGPLAPETAVRWALELAEGLDHAHAQGVVHRDVKPANILLEGGTTPRLADFGIALRLGHDSVALTKDGELLGTPLYMAPEQVQGGPVDGRADVYALGAVLYEMLSGRPPHRPDHPARLLHNVLHTRPPAPSTVRPGVSDDLDRVCARALAKAPDGRYPTMRAFADDLQRALDGRPVTAPSPPPLQAPRRRLLGVAALVATLALGGGGAHWLAGRTHRTADAMLADVEAQIEAWSAAGDHELSDIAFRAFAEAPAVRGTPALSRGWLRQADRLRQRGAASAELAALAVAFDTAWDENQTAAALLALADALRTRARWSDLAATATLAATTVDSAEHGPELAALIAEGRTLRRDLGRPTGPTAPLLRALAVAQPTEQRRGKVHRLAGAAGEPDQLLVQRRSGDWTLHPLGDTGLAHGVPVPQPPGRVALPAGPGRLVVRHAPSATLYRVAPGTLSPITSWPGRPRGIAPLAVGPDGRATAVSGGHRGEPLSRVDLDTGADASVHPPTERADSAVEHLAVADFDADGTEELMLLVGAWSAFDLRVLEPDPDGPSPYRLADRLKLGHAYHLSVLRRPPHRPLAIVSKPEGWSSRVAVSESEPNGHPNGLYEASWDGDRLDVARLPTDALDCQRTWTGDIDGDGLDDVVAGCADGAQVYRTQPDGSLAGTFLRGVEPAGVLDVDDDGDAELVATLTDRGDRLWVLGAGSDPLPVVREARPVQAPVDPTVHPSLARAEALAQVGLVAEASERLEALAVLEPALRGPALLRSAQLLAESGDPRRAEARFLDAALRLPEADVPLAYLGAARAARDDLRLHDALAHLQPLVDSPAADEAAGQRAAIEARGGGPPPAVWSFAAGVPADARVLSPLGVRVEPTPARGVHLTSSGDTPLLALPVELHGSAVRIEADLTLERLEWASGLSIGLETDTGAPLLGARLDARGGGQVVFSELRCPVDVRRTVVAPTPARPAAAQEERIQLRVVLLDGVLTCSVTGLGPADRSRTAVRAVETPPPGRHRLILRGTTLADSPAQVVARLHRIEAEGLTAASAPPAPTVLDRVRRLLADHRPTEALAVLSEAPDPQDDTWLLHQLVGLDDSGRVAEAQDLLADRLATGRPPWLPAFLRSRPERWTAWVAETLPPGGWLPLFHLAYFDAAWQHPEDPHLIGRLQRNLDAIDDRPPATLETLTLRVVRARAFLDTEPQRARRLLEAAIAWATARLPSDAPEVGLQLAVAHRHLATLALRNDDTQAALDHLHAGLAVSPTPELTADTYYAAEELLVLQAHPRWATIDATRHQGQRAEAAAPGPPRDQGGRVE